MYSTISNGCDNPSSVCRNDVDPSNAIDIISQYDLCIESGDRPSRLRAVTDFDSYKPILPHVRSLRRNREVFSIGACDADTGNFQPPHSLRFPNVEIFVSTPSIAFSSDRTAEPEVDIALPVLHASPSPSILYFGDIPFPLKQVVFC